MPLTGKRGRQPEFSDAAIQICLTMKVLLGMPLRQNESVKAPPVRAHWRTGFVESRLRLAGLDWRIPDLGTLCRNQKTLNVTIQYRGGSGRLHLLIDTTGIKTEGEGAWGAERQKKVRGTVARQSLKHGGSKK